MDDWLAVHQGRLRDAYQRAGTHLDKHASDRKLSNERKTHPAPLKGLRNIARQHDMCKNIIYNYTLLVTNIRLLIRQTKKTYFVQCPNLPNKSLHFAIFGIEILV